MIDANWAAATSGDWNTGANWDTGAVPDATTDAKISVAGSYIVSIGAGSVANSVIFGAASAILTEGGDGSLTANSFTMTARAGVAIFESANQFGALNLRGGLLEVTTAAALGGGALNLYGGTLAALQSMTVTDALTFRPSTASSTVTIDAATDKTLDIGSGGWTIEKGPAGATDDIVFNAPLASLGTGGTDGTVLWHGANGHFAGGSSAMGLDLKVDIDGGTFVGADAAFGSILGNDTSVHSGGTIDFNGHSASIENLVVDSGGHITSTAASTGHLTIAATGAIDGAINGNIAVEVAQSATYSGDESYSGSTLIDAGANLEIATAAAGVPTGTIVDKGTLTFAVAGTPAFAQDINGAGRVVVLGDNGGTVTFGGDNTYKGGTDIAGGIVAANNAESLSTGNLSIENGGELVAAVSLKQLDAIADGMTTLGTATIAAADGATFTFKADALDFSAGTLTFGDANGNDGIVRFGVTPGHLTDAGLTIVAVAAGTLEAANGGLSTLLTGAKSTAIADGATLDTNGLVSGIHNLHGAGLLTSSGAASTLDLNVATFNGDISGALSLTVHGSVTLKGDTSFTGNATIEQGALLHLGGTFGEDVAFGGAKAVLQIDASDAFSGAIFDFGKGDAVDLTNLGKAATLSWDATAHTLTVSSNGHSDVLTFDGNYTAANFGLTHDSGGHAEIVFEPTPIAAVHPEHTGDLWA